VNEHVFATIITDDKAEALLTIEEFDDARAFANDLRGHTATTAAAAGKAAKAAASGTIATAEAAAITAEATAAAAAEAVTAAEAAAKTAATTTAASASALIVEIVVAETVALVLAAPAAATSVKTHALLVTFASPQDQSDKHVGRMTCTIHRKGAVWESLYQLFRGARMFLQATFRWPLWPIARARRTIGKAFDCGIAALPIEGKA
jgi:hypothetical protein